MSFTLEAGPDTDIWKKPPTKNVWTAPISRTTSGPLKKFASARVTFWASWTERYDQGGVLLVPRRKSATEHPPAQWIKTGVELYQGQPRLSTVSTDRFADWSVGPITTPIDPEKGITVEIRREGDENGKSAWVYQLVLDDAGQVQERIPLREICWIFADENEGGGEEWILEVSPLIARPEKKATEALHVKFTDFSVEWLP
jgi:hypothetical protein